MIPKFVLVFMTALALLVLFEMAFAVLSKRRAVVLLKALAAVLYWAGATGLACALNLMPPAHFIDATWGIALVVVYFHVLNLVAATDTPEKGSQCTNR